MRVAIIPARGGSKRIPRKNVRAFYGKPMLAWSIAAAQESGCFDRIVVSTDDREIASVAQGLGAEIPFLRPAELADDYTDTIAVIAHAIEALQAQGSAVAAACCIYATAPFVRAQDIQRGLRVLEESKAGFAFSVTSYAFPIQRAIRINCDNRVEMFQPENFNKRSQDLEEAWHDAGQFYWGSVGAWLSRQPLFSAQSAPVTLPRYRVQDIDTPEDWRRAELLFEVLRRDNAS